MIRTAPPQAGQVSMSMPKTRFRRCAQVVAARRIRTSPIGECQNAECSGSTARNWPMDSSSLSR
jgi:hypothetical protein